jgi:hypothetical protein
MTVLYGLALVARIAKLEGPEGGVMYVVERYSTVLRPGRAEDGPPYGKPGVWSIIGRHATAKLAEQARQRVIAPGMGKTLSPDRCRVRQVR